MKPIYESIIPSANASFKVESYGPTSKCETAGWHIHPEYEIVYVKNGSGTLKIGNKTYNYTDGTLVFLAGNIPHSDFGNNEKKNSQEIVIQFSKETVYDRLTLFPELHGMKQLIEMSKYVLIFEDEVKANLSTYLERFDALDNQGKLINLFFILDYLSRNDQYVCLFDSYPINKYKKNEIDRLEEAFEYVNNNYSKNISVAQISHQLGYTANSFCRFFKKMTNRRFIDFVNEFRIEKAVEAFNENNTMIAQVMYNSGFNDPSYFTKQFKKYQGMTPSVYLKSKYAQSLT
nr:AraC family transcriptional regulator [uncultured Allomuricauda sp.]